MSEAAALLAKCRERGITFRPGEGGKLKVSPPPERLPGEIVEELRRHKGEILALLKTQQDTPQPCSFCGEATETWVFNRGTCWQRVICRGCQNRVTMPTVHVCDPSLPLTAPCKGQERQPWVCSRCETTLKIESVEEVNGRTLTFWRCPKGCSVGVTPATVAVPPVLVPKVEQ